MMPRNLALAFTCTATLLLSACCHCHDHPAPATKTSATPASEPMPILRPSSDALRMALNASALQGLPHTVHTAFLRDYPDVAITSVNQVPLATGVTLFQISFFRSGVPMQAAYYLDGSPYIPQQPLLEVRPGHRLPPPATTRPSATPTAEPALMLQTAQQ